MAIIEQLHTNINTTEPVTKRLINLWATATTDLMSKKNIVEVSVEPTVANRYKYDFYGLLLYSGVEPKYHYPHLLVNGYTNPTSFKGDVYTMKVINKETLARYYQAFTKNLVL